MVSKSEKYPSRVLYSRCQRTAALPELHEQSCVEVDHCCLVVLPIFTMLASHMHREFFKFIYLTGVLKLFKFINLSNRCHNRECRLICSL